MHSHACQKPYTRVFMRPCIVARIVRSCRSSASNIRASTNWASSLHSSILTPSQSFFSKPSFTTSHVNVSAYYLAARVEIAIRPWSTTGQQKQSHHRASCSTESRKVICSWAFQLWKSISKMFHFHAKSILISFLLSLFITPAHDVTLGKQFFSFSCHGLSELPLAARPVYNFHYRR